MGIKTVSVYKASIKLEIRQIYANQTFLPIY